MRFKLHRSVWFIVAIFLLGYAGYTALPSLCENEIQSVAKAPHSSLEAKTYVRSCGATTPFSTQISLSNRRGAFFIIKNKWPVYLEWQSDKTLMVSIPKEAAEEKVYRQKNDWGGVKIDYKVGEQ